MNILSILLCVIGSILYSILNLRHCGFRDKKAWVQNAAFCFVTVLFLVLLQIAPNDFLEKFTVFAQACIETTIIYNLL